MRLIQPPPTSPALNAWGAAITGSLVIFAAAVMAEQGTRLAVQTLGLDAATAAVGRTVVGGGVSAVVAGAGGAVLLAMVGRLRWAIAYACWLALGLGVVVGTVLADLGAGMTNAAQQGALMSAMAVITPAFFYAMFLMAREALVRPTVWMLDFLDGVLTAIATLTPWGPRWGKALAILAAIWLVFGTAAVLLRGGALG